MRRALLLLTALAAAGCHSSSSKSSSVPRDPGIATDEDGGPKELSALCPSDQKKLCDWSAAEGGGYGHVTVCDGATITQYPDQATCLANFPAGCATATVADWEACRLAEVMDPCGALASPPDACAPLAACIGLTDGSAYSWQLSCGDDGGEGGPDGGDDGSME